MFISEKLIKLLVTVFARSQLVNSVKILISYLVLGRESIRA